MWVVPMQDAGKDILFQLNKQQHSSDENLFQQEHAFHRKKNVLAQLKKDIFLQRFSAPKNNFAASSLYPFATAFPFNQFPLGCIHEFICPSQESFSSSSAFVCGILSSLKLTDATIIWISSSQKMFPPSFKFFGITPHNIIFINIEKPKDILYTSEEALRCDGITAVITDIRELNFKQSRRLQLATEQSRVTGFVLRNNPRSINTTACVSRWLISPSISTSYQHIPGIGFPSWKVDLQKVRNGKPQSWYISWQAGHFIHEQEVTTSIVHHKKAV